MIVPALTHYGIRDSLYESEPVCIPLAEIEIRELDFRRKGTFIEEGLAHARAICDALVFDVLICFDVDQGGGSQHR